MNLPPYQRNLLVRLFHEQDFCRVLMWFVSRVIVKHELIVLNRLPLLVVFRQLARFVEVLVFRPIRRRWDFWMINEREDSVNPVSSRLRLEMTELSTPVFRADVLHCPRGIDDVNACGER